MADLDGAAAIVTGGASGIGAASVRRLARAGARVVVVDVDEARGTAVAAEVGGRFAAADVADPAAWAALLAETEAALGPPGIAHLNAGVATGAYPVRLEDLTDEQYRRVMGVNVDGVVFGIRALIPVMARRGGGAIVVTASLAGLMPLSPDPLYGATKHFVVGLVRSLAGPLAAHGITVNAVCPGGVDTPLLLDTGRRERLVRSMPLMDPDDVAKVVEHLLQGDETGRLEVVLADRVGRYEPPDPHEVG